jgi:hypothetical protein
MRLGLRPKNSFFIGQRPPRQEPSSRKLCLVPTKEKMSPKAYNGIRILIFFYRFRPFLPVCITESRLMPNGGALSLTGKERQV